MKIFKYIYYFLLCHLFPNKITKGALGDGFEMTFVKEGDRWYADIKHWPGSKWQLEMVAGADDLLDYYLPYSNTPNKVVMRVGTRARRTGELRKIEEFSNGANYRDTVTGKKVYLCNVSKWVFGKHPEVIRYTPAYTNWTPYEP